MVTARTTTIRRAKIRRAEFARPRPLPPSSQQLMAIKRYEEQLKKYKQQQAKAQQQRELTKSVLMKIQKKATGRRIGQWDAGEIQELQRLTKQYPELGEAMERGALVKTGQYLPLLFTGKQLKKFEAEGFKPQVGVKEGERVIEFKEAKKPMVEVTTTEPSMISSTTKQVMVSPAVMEKPPLKDVVIEDAQTYLGQAGAAAVPFGGTGAYAGGIFGASFLPRAKRVVTETIPAQISRLNIIERPPEPEPTPTPPSVPFGGGGGGGGTDFYEKVFGETPPFLPPPTIPTEPTLPTLPPVSKPSVKEEVLTPEQFGRVRTGAILEEQFKGLTPEQLQALTLVPEFTGIYGTTTREGVAFTYQPTEEQIGRARTQAEEEYKKLGLGTRAEMRIQEFGIGATKGIFGLGEFAANIIPMLGMRTIKEGEQFKLFDEPIIDFSKVESIKEIRETPVGYFGKSVELGVGLGVPIAGLGYSAYRSVKMGRAAGLTASEIAGEFAIGLSPIRLQRTVFVEPPYKPPKPKVSEFVPSEIGKPTTQVFKGVTKEGMEISQISLAEELGGRPIGLGVQFVKQPTIRRVKFDVFEGVKFEEIAPSRAVDVSLTGGYPKTEEFPSTVLTAKGDRFMTGLELPKTTVQETFRRPIIRFRETGKELEMTSLLGEPTTVRKPFVGVRPSGEITGRRFRVEEFDFGVGEDVFVPRIKTPKEFLPFRETFLIKGRPREQPLKLPPESPFIPEFLGTGKRFTFISPEEGVLGYRIPKTPRIDFQLQQQTMSSLLGQVSTAKTVRPPRLPKTPTPRPIFEGDVTQRQISSQMEIQKAIGITPQATREIQKEKLFVTPVQAPALRTLTRERIVPIQKQPALISQPSLVSQREFQLTIPRYGQAQAQATSQREVRGLLGGFDFRMRPSRPAFYPAMIPPSLGMFDFPRPRPRLKRRLKRQPSLIAGVFDITSTLPRSEEVTGLFIRPVLKKKKRRRK